MKLNPDKIDDAGLALLHLTAFAVRLNRTVKAVRYRRVLKGISAWHGSCAG